MVSTTSPIITTLELNLPKKRSWIEEQALPKPSTPSEWFAQKFPDAVSKYGCPFLEMRETNCNGFKRITPVSINLDFFAGLLGGDSKLGHSVVYFEPEMLFYYFEPFLELYKPTSQEKLQNYYRAMLLRCAQELANDVDKLNLFNEFRSDKNTKAVVQRAKSMLAADSSFFSATSPHSRIRGIELHERMAKRFVEELLTSEPGQILKLQVAYEVFCSLLRERHLEPVKRADFKGIMVPLVRDQFNVCLRNDLDDAGGRGWKDVMLLNRTGPR